MNPSIISTILSVATLGIMSQPHNYSQRNHKIKGDKRAAKRLRKISEKSRKRNRRAA